MPDIYRLSEFIHLITYLFGADGNPLIFMWVIPAIECVWIRLLFDKLQKMQIALSDARLFHATWLLLATVCFLHWDLEFIGGFFRILCHLFLLMMCFWYQCSWSSAHSRSYGSSFIPLMAVERNWRLFYSFCTHCRNELCTRLIESTSQNRIPRRIVGFRNGLAWKPRDPFLARPPLILPWF